MQQLWAKILKQEILRPGSTSIKALTLLETMTQREAQALQRACALSSTFGQDSTKKLVTGFRRRQELGATAAPRAATQTLARALPAFLYRLDVTDGFRAYPAHRA